MMLARHREQVVREDDQVRFEVDRALKDRGETSHGHEGAQVGIGDLHHAQGTFQPRRLETALAALHRIVSVQLVAARRNAEVEADGLLPWDDAPP